MSECPKCGKIIKSGETLCNECKSASSPGLSVGVETVPEDSAPEIDEIEHVRLSEDSGKESMLNSASEICSQEDDDEKLTLEEDLIKVQEDPFDDFNQAESGDLEDDSEPLVKTSLSDEIEPDDDFEDENTCETDPSETARNDKTSSLSGEMGMDKIYVIPDKTVSSSERDELISSLQSKIPNIMQQKQTNINQDNAGDIPLSPEKELWKEERKYNNDKIADDEKEPMTEILASPFTPPRESKENPAVFVRGSKMFFPPGTNLKTGENISLGGRSYSIRKKEFNKKSMILAGVLGVVLIIFFAVILTRILAPAQPGQVVGLVLNSETYTVIPSAEIILNGLDETLLTDANGMFEYAGLQNGDWSVIATKPHYRTASLGFNLLHGKTTVLTLYMDPVIPASASKDGQDKGEADSKKTVSKTVLNGQLQVITNIDQAMVIVDNKVLGPSNKVYSRLYTGEHKLVVMKEGYKEYSGTFTIKNDKTTTLDIKLEEIEVAYNPSEISFDEYLAKADDLAAKGSWQEAAGNYTMALAKQEQAGIYCKRAIAYLNLGQKNQAQSDYLKASRHYTQNGHVSQSIECLNELLKIAPGNTTGLRERGFAFLRTGDYQGALADLQNAVGLDQESFANQIALGEALYIMGDYKEALKYLKKARKLDENNARAYALSALASMARGKEKDARKYYQEFETHAADIDIREFSGDPDWQRLAHLVIEEE